MIKLKQAKQAKCHIRTGDQVVVLTGKTRGKTGTVIRVWPSKQRALVDGEAAIYDTKHVRPNPQAGVEGGRVQRLRPIHVSNLALLDPETGKACRVRRERGDQGVIRVSKTSGHRFE